MNLMTIENVRGYVKDGIAYLNLEDVARGLGFTQQKNDVEYIRWETVTAYLRDLGFSQLVGKDTFIPENVFYRLAMKAKNDTAEAFQAKVADEILPTIRKTGHYGVPQLSSAEIIAAIANQAVEQERRVKALEERVSETNEALNTIQETFLQRDDDWRKSINTMLNGAAYRMGGGYRDIRTRSYTVLEERARCDLDKRLRNLVERLELSGATKTQLKNTSRMDVIEADPRLKEIYTAVVKELSIGSLKLVR